MPLRQRKRFQRPGMPELTGAILLVVTVACASLWWRSRDQILWYRTAGKVVECDIRRIHYNAPPSPYRLEMAYEYWVSGTRIAGLWDGYWPLVESPNALPAERIAELQTPGYPLVVFYDPENVVVSRLHDAPRGRRSAYASTAFGGFALTLLYMVRLYPQWKMRRWRASAR